MDKETRVVGVFFFLLFWCLVGLMYEQLISSDQAGA